MISPVALVESCPARKAPPFGASLSPPFPGRDQMAAAQPEPRRPGASRSPGGIREVRNQRWEACFFWVIDSTSVYYYI